eukprot:4398-Heterococcus_DN1.PRE.2
MHSASKASGDAHTRVTAPSSSESSTAAVAPAQWDCTTCNAALQEALRRDRPSRLMQAVQAGMSANNTAAQEQPAAYNDFDCGTTAVCELCPSTGPGAGARAYFMVDPATIVLCVNQMHRGEAEVEEVLVHELVHAYDFCAAKRDLSRCQDLARSEVRAAREAECHYNTTATTNHTATASATTNSAPAEWWFAHSWRDCVRQKAIRSTSQMCPTTAAQCVDAVFTEAMADSVPLHTQPVHGVYSDTLQSIKQWWGSSGSANSSSSTSASSSSNADTTVNSKTNSSSSSTSASSGHASVNQHAAKTGSSSSSSTARDTNPRCYSYNCKQRVIVLKTVSDGRK